MTMENTGQTQYDNHLGEECRKFRKHMGVHSSIHGGPWIFDQNIDKNYNTDDLNSVQTPRKAENGSKPWADLKHKSQNVFERNE